MALYNNTPVFLDYNSGWKGDQVDTINLIVRIARRRFEAKAKQKQLEKPKTSNIVKTRYGRAVNLLNYLYKDNFSISFVLNTANMTKGSTYHIFDLEEDVSISNQLGSSSNSTNPSILNSYGYFYKDYYMSQPAIYFKCEDDSFPTDSSGNRLQYSVYIGGVTSFKTNRS